MTREDALRGLASNEGWSFDVLEDTNSDLDGRIMDMCPEANKTWDATDPLWRTGTLRGVVEETAPIFAQVYARGGRGSTATDLLFDLVKIHEIITDHRISAGIARPESQEETITHDTEWTEVTE